MRWTNVQKSKSRSNYCLASQAGRSPGWAQATDTSRREDVQLRVSIPMVKPIQPAELDRRLPHRLLSRLAQEHLHQLIYLGAGVIGPKSLPVFVLAFGSRDGFVHAGLELR